MGIVLKVLHAELLLKKRGLHSNCEEDDGRGREIYAVHDSVSEDFSQMPAVWVRRWLDSIFRYRQYRSVVQNSENEDLKGFVIIEAMAVVCRFLP